MKKVIKIIKELGLFIGVLLLYILFITSISYINFISYNIICIFNIIFMISTFIIFGFKESKKFDRKGYKSGFIKGVKNIIIIILLSILIQEKIDYSIIIYYILLIISSTIGGMIGINFKVKEQ